MDYAIGSRYGIMPKHAKNENEIVWFSLPSHYVFHYSNGWEETNEKGEVIIKFTGCKYD